MAINGENAPPWQKWDEKAFEADTDVQDMNTVQRWMYRTLCQKAWTCETRPDLPNDDNKLRQMAGCKLSDKQLWEDNKAAVLSMFTPDEIKGQSVLYRGRLRRDWDKLTTEKEFQSERGRRGGLTAHHGREAALQKPVNVFVEIPALCRKLLHMDPEWKEAYRIKLKELERAHGGNAVVAAFETWAAEDYIGDSKYPISKFTQVAEQYIGGSYEKHDSELDDICATLYRAGGQAFSGKTRHELRKLVAKFGKDDVVPAYTTYIGSLDEFQMKRAPENFCAGAAGDVITAKRRQAEAVAKTKELLETESARLEREAAAELQSEEETMEEL